MMMPPTAILQQKEDQSIHRQHGPNNSQRNYTGRVCVVVTPDIPLYLKRSKTSFTTAQTELSAVSRSSSSLDTMTRSSSKHSLDSETATEIKVSPETTITQRCPSSSPNSDENHDVHSVDDSSQSAEKEADEPRSSQPPSYFIPGITGRALCLSPRKKKPHKSDHMNEFSCLIGTEPQMNESISTNDDLSTIKPSFFIPGINGKARCLKKSSKQTPVGGVSSGSLGRHLQKAQKPKK